MGKMENGESTALKLNELNYKIIITLVHKYNVNGPETSNKNQTCLK